MSAGYPLRTSAEALEAGDSPFVQLKNVSLERGVDWQAVAHVSLPSSRTQKLLNNGDVLFSARGGKNYGYLVSNPPEKSVCAPHFFVLSIKDKEILDPAFLVWQLNQKPAQDYFERTATGSNITNIRRLAIEKLSVAIPPIETQRSITAFAKTAMRERLVLQCLIDSRRQQSNAIAAQLFQQFRGNAS